MYMDCQAADLLLVSFKVMNYNAQASVEMAIQFVACWAVILKLCRHGLVF
jgi:hypothetical protein